MSIPDSTFSRATTAAASCGAKVAISRNVPSTRKRTRKLSVGIRVEEVRCPAAAHAPAVVALASIDECLDDDFFGLLRELMRDAVGLVVAIDRGGDFVFERDDRVDFASGGEPEIVERLEVLRRGHRDGQRGADLRDREGAMAARHLFGKRVDRFRIHGVGVDAEAGEPELNAERAEYGVLRRGPQVDEHLADAPAGTLLLLDGGVEVRFGNELALEKNRAERGTAVRGTRGGAFRGERRRLAPRCGGRIECECHSGGAG